jgi:PKD repeat protein
LSVSFTDLSTGAPTSWSWDFGDGNTSTAQNPSHTYDTPGTYTVSLTATNSFGSDTVDKVDYITVNTPPPPPTADFSGTPTLGDAPLSVSFTDLSTGAPTSWSWDFGDGNTSTAQNPSHTYANSGAYTVSLTVSNGGGSDTVDKVDYITVNAPPPNPLYISLASSGTVGGVSAGDEDILWFDGNTWSLYFDGSDVGVNGDLNAFYIVDADTILMSFSKPNTFGSVTIDDHDIAEFTVTTLGANTAGSFSLFFNGDAADLTAPYEDIDAMHLLPDGRLIISTLGSPDVPGVSNPKDEDFLAFRPTTAGDFTSGGTWEMYFDSSDLGFSGSADMNAVSFATNGDIYLSPENTVFAGSLTVYDEDVMICTPISLGEITECNFSTTLYFDGSIWTIDGNDLDSIHLP